MGVVLGKNSKERNSYEESNTDQTGMQEANQNDNNNHVINNRISVTEKERKNRYSIHDEMESQENKNNNVTQNTQVDDVVSKDIGDNFDSSNVTAEKTDVRLKSVVDDVSIRHSSAHLASKLSIRQTDEEQVKSSTDFETEVLTHVENEVQSAMKECSLEKLLHEWATSAIVKKIRDIIFITIKYKGQSLNKDLRKKVADLFLTLEFVEYSISFVTYAKEEIAEIFHRDESLYSNEIDELNKLKKKPDKNTTSEDGVINKTVPNIKNGESQGVPVTGEGNESCQNVDIPEENEMNSTNISSNEPTDNENITSQLKQLKQMKCAQSILGSIMAVNINCSNVSKEFCRKILQSGFVEKLLDFLEVYMEINEETEKADYSYNKIKLNGRLRIFNYVLGTLVNMIKHSEFHHVFKWANIVERASPYLRCPLQLFAMKVLLALATLIEESNNHVIMSDAEPIKLLLLYIRGACKDEKNRYVGFELKELVEGIALIAQNDSNNKIIGENSGVKTLSFAFLASTYIEDETEKRETLAACCHAIWRLSFNEDNRKKLREDVSVTEYLKKLKEMESSDLQEKASGSYWELVGKTMRSQNKDCDESKDTEESSLEQKQQHIMISYQWKYQDILLKVRDQLQEVGFNVWMDVDQMGGSTLEAMANAVEDASIVLMAVSSEYKQSANCRSEAEYAFQLKRSFIPLMMQANYTADGWLGFIVGAKYWIDFIEPTQFDISFDKLLKEISKTLEIDVKSNENQSQKVEQTKESSAPTSNVLTPKTSVNHWTSREVNAWLKNINLSLSDRKYKHQIDGKLLTSLKKIKQEAPQAFYDICRQDLKFDFIETIKFSEELSKTT